jgi:hypothetical protein
MTPHKVRIVNVRLKQEFLPKVSMHALLRYAERICGFDVVKARLALSGPEIQHGIIHGADAVKVSGMKVCLKGNVVVTVLGKEQRPKPGRVFKSFRELADAAE